METNNDNNSVINPEANSPLDESNFEANASESIGEENMNETNSHHKPHTISWRLRYKMYKNHSSWNDSPHTNTSY